MKPWKPVLALTAAYAACCAVPLLGGAAVLTVGASVFAALGVALWACRDEVRRKLDELKSLETSLAAFVCGCDAACVGGPAVDCTILEDLSMSARTASPVASGRCP